MKYELHPACSAWPPMTPEELRDLANDISAYGLRDPVTLTPDGLLLDGRNRAIACEMADVEPATTIIDGDPWLFSLSRNKHRRHMTVDQIAMVAAKMATLPRGKSNLVNPSNEGISAAEAAKVAGVPETAIDSAKVVLQHGTPDERKAVESGEARLRKTADQIRDRKRASQRPVTLRGKKTPVYSHDPIDGRDTQADHEVRRPKETAAHVGPDVVDHRVCAERDQAGSRAPRRRSQGAHGPERRRVLNRGQSR
jgi:hypothetical protein